MQIRQRDSLRLPPRVLWLIAPPLAVFAVGDVLQAWLGWDRSLAPPPLDPTGGWIRTEAAGRLTMMAAFLAAITVGLITVFMSASDLLRLFGTVARRQLLAAAAAAAGALVVWVGATSIDWVGATSSFIPDIIEYPGRGFITSALDLAEPELSKRLWWSNMIVRIVFVVGALGVIIATVSCLAEPVRSRPPWARRALQRLQRRRLRRYLNLAAALMTAGLLFMVAWMRWPGFVYSGTQHTAYVAHINALALYFGVCYSALIASYYVPVVAILRIREATALLGRDLQRGDGSLAESPSADVMGKGLAVLMPALAGIAPSIFELLRAGASG